MSENKTKRFAVDTWAKGTRGLLAAHATDKCRIVNMRVWDDGLLGPRPLWRAATSLPTTFGALTKLFPARYNYGNDIHPNQTGICVAGTVTHFFAYDTGTAYAETASTSGSWGPDAFLTQIDAERWLLNEYLIDLSGPAPATPKTITVTNISSALTTAYGGASTIQPQGATVHQGRAFYWGPATAGGAYALSNRMYYSDDQDFVTFTADDSGFFDVDGVIAGAVSVGSNLFIWTEEGSWYMLQGRGDPAVATVNYLGKNRIPGQGRQPKMFDRVCYFMASDTQVVVTLSEGGTFDEESLGHLGLSGAALPYSEAAPPSLEISSLANSVLSPGNPTEGHNHEYNGVWCEEDWGFSTYGNFQVGVDEILHREMCAVFVTGSPGHWDVMWRPISNEEPSPSAAGDFSEYEETEDCSLYLPRILEPTQQVRIRRITIDAQTWSSSGAYWPAATMTVACEDGQGTSHAFTLGPASDPLGSVPNVANTPIRIVATPTDGPMPFTHLCDVSFTSMAGIAIESVTVDYEVSQGMVL